ncbi:hypothetical protein BX070DRAFT_223916 [Coemansia spiralis]|nr:hypothetical protein BX070DRAFT_223916 [Coemansia spiralis]
MRAEWTLKDDQRLLELLSLDKTWEQVAYSMGKFTGQQCIRRKYSLIYRQKRLDKQQAILANSEQPPVTGALPDGTVVTLGKIEFSNIQKKNTIAKHTKTWSRVDDDKLYDLVTQQREFDYNYLKSYFPGTSISQMYQALQRISSARFEDHGYKMWTREEEEILLRLVQKHGAKWKKIAEEMPTERRPMQCLMFYRYAINGVERRRDIWTKKETLRLETLVELFMQGKLLPLSEQKGLISNPQSSKSPTVLFPDKLASVEQLERILCYLKRQRLCEKLSADSGSMQNKRINWNLIAPYMAPKTKTQCNIGWHNLQEARRKATNPSCEEPWTREEDLGLYTLYAQAPKQWSWIIKHLPRYRYRHSVKYRYNNHIKYYIDLLRKRKKPSWDPTDDQFEEVHRLCEIKAWRARRLTGYRIKDGYIPPADLNLNGDSYCF